MGPGLHNTGRSPYVGPDSPDVKWVFDLGGTTHFRSPSIGPDGTIYAVSETVLFALNPDGSERWKVSCDDNVQTLPAVDEINNVVYTGNNYNQVLKVDLASGEITVEVVDTTTPTLDPAANMTVLWPANHKMVDIVIEANASDNIGLPITLSASISSNEPINGTGDGDHSPDWTEPVIDQENGIITFQLRAERSGKGDGRVYTITITATDSSNNSASSNLAITVPHDKKKK